MSCYRDDCFRVYLPWGAVTHLLSPYDSPNSAFPALCGRRPRLFTDWLGTGSQSEYETAERLPLCQRCGQVAGPGQT